MPELPEVEITRRGLAPHVECRVIERLIVRQARLRWPVEEAIGERVTGLTIIEVTRRGKYLTINCGAGYLLLHLGMSGSLRVCRADHPAGKHDHFDLVLEDGNCLRFNDPRRFGALLWHEQEPASHPLLCNQGPEPLCDSFDGGFLYQRSRNRTRSVKSFIMDHRVVAGIGNIYANEVLFAAGIRPTRGVGTLGEQEWDKVVGACRQVLERAIDCGGTTISDYANSSGDAGYFQCELKVYGRFGETCQTCGNVINRLVLAGRATFYCPSCQK